MVGAGRGSRRTRSWPMGRRPDSVTEGARVLVFYVDEFGQHGLSVVEGSEPVTLKRGCSPWFVLAAVGLRSSSRKPLAEAIVKLKSRHFGDAYVYEPWAETELKGRYVRELLEGVASGHRADLPDGYAVLDTKQAAAALISDLDILLAKFRPLIFTVAVDKVRVLELGAKGQPPLGAAYAFLMQRVARTMEDLHNGDGAILVADQQDEHEQLFRSGEINRVRDHFHQSLGRQPNYNVVLDKPLWIDTKLSTWDREIIQLADLVAYTVGWCVEHGTPPTGPSFLWDRISSLMAIHWGTGRIESGGFAIYPKPDRFPTQ
jgi:hypothetical protein